MSPRPDKFHFYTDENFPAPAGEFLRSKGHSVFMSIEKKNLRTATDLYQIREAARRNCIFITLDHDFRTNESLAGAICRSPGVILIYATDFNSINIIKIIKKHLSVISESKILNKVCRISIDKIEYINL